MPVRTFAEVKRRIRLAVDLIPSGGIYGEIRMVLNDVLRMRSTDAAADLQRAITALDGLPEWDWANAARRHLEYAVNYFDE